MNKMVAGYGGPRFRNWLPLFMAAASLGVGLGTLRAEELVKRVVSGPENAYFTYPHANGFLSDGRSFVLARPERDGLSFLAFDPATATEKELGWVQHADLYYSLSEDGKRMALTADNALYVWDLESGQPPKLVRQDSPEEKGLWWQTVSDISPGGDRIISMRKRKKGAGLDDQAIRCQMLLHDLKTGKTEVLLETDWWLNHVHFSPYNVDWICFSHEGDTEKISDRIWVWNAKEAAKGKNLFAQIGEDGKPLFVGHERAAFHADKLLFVAYGVSEGGPRGLYECGFDGKSRLVSQGDRDYHCNISRDGRWAVVDTTGPYDAPGKGWENSNSISDILAVDMQNGQRTKLYRANLQKHPWHPHPHISPDGRWVVLNDAKKRAVVVLEIDQAALDRFLN